MPSSSEIVKYERPLPALKRAETGWIHVSSQLAVTMRGRAQSCDEAEDSRKYVEWRFHPFQCSFECSHAPIGVADDVGRREDEKQLRCGSCGALRRWLANDSGSLRLLHGPSGGHETLFFCDLCGRRSHRRSPILSRAFSRHLQPPFAPTSSRTFANLLESSRTFVGVGRTRTTSRRKRSGQSSNQRRRTRTRTNSAKRSFSA